MSLAALKSASNIVAVEELSAEREDIRKLSSKKLVSKFPEVFFSRMENDINVWIMLPIIFINR